MGTANSLHRTASRQQVFQPTRGEIDSRIGAVIEAARGRSRDTVLYLAMTELQRLCPDLNQAELMGMYADVLARLAVTEEHRQA